jgi:hypothetical protein
MGCVRADMPTSRADYAKDEAGRSFHNRAAHLDKKALVLCFP